MKSIYLRSSDGHRFKVNKDLIKSEPIKMFFDGPFKKEKYLDMNFSSATVKAYILFIQTGKLYSAIDKELKMLADQYMDKELLFEIAFNEKIEPKIDSLEIDNPFAQLSMINTEKIKKLRMIHYKNFLKDLTKSNIEVVETFIDNKIKQKHFDNFIKTIPKSKNKYAQDFLRNIEYNVRDLGNELTDEDYALGIEAMKTYSETKNRKKLENFSKILEEKKGIKRKRE